MLYRKLYSFFYAEKSGKKESVDRNHKLVYNDNGELYDELY